jgi:fused signal recognition particle receptor
VRVRFWRRKPSEQDAESGEAPVAVEVAGGLELTEEEVAEVHEQTERAVERSRRGLFGRIGSLFEKPDFDEDLWYELEDILVASDTGIGTTEDILAHVQERVRKDSVKQSARVREILREELIAILERPRQDRPPGPGPMPPSGSCCLLSA